MNLSKIIILSLGLAAMLHSLVGSAFAQDPTSWPTPDATNELFYVAQDGTVTSLFGTENEYFADNLIRIFYGSGDMMQFSLTPNDIILDDAGAAVILQFDWSSYNTQGYGPARADLWIATGSGEFEFFDPAAVPEAPPGTFMRLRQTYVVTSTFPTTEGYSVNNPWSYLTIAE